MLARGTPTSDCTLRSMRSSRACVSTEIVTSSGMWSPSMSWRTNEKSVSLALGNPEDAREVFQETWLRALERLDTLRETDRLAAWLVSIALNQVRARLRRSGGIARREPDERVEAIDESDVGERLAEREEAELLRARMRELPARQREVMDLRVNHGLSHAEIAALLEISEESSRANYYQALRRLRAAFHVETERT